MGKAMCGRSGYGGALRSFSIGSCLAMSGVVTDFTSCQIGDTTAAMHSRDPTLETVVVSGGIAMEDGKGGAGIRLDYLL